MYRCIACNRQIETPAATIIRSGLTGHYGPRCAQKVGLLKPLPGFTPKPSKPRKRKAKPEETQMELELTA